MARAKCEVYPEYEGISMGSGEPDPAWLSAETARIKAKGSSWRWRLIAANGEIVASGEAYASKANALRGAADFLHAAADPEIVVLE